MYVILFEEKKKLSKNIKENKYVKRKLIRRVLYTYIKYIYSYYMIWYNSN